MKKGILLINLGTPDSPSTKDVRKYLREFLMDERVIDLPYLQRWLLVNLIIATFRAPKSAKIYQEVWTDKGSPLLIFSEKIKQNWQKHVGNDVVVELGMRYQTPSIESALNRLKKQNITELEIIPLYPQYASSSSGSSIEKAMEILNTWQSIPSISIVSNFFQKPELIDGFTSVLAKNAKALMEKEQYDHIVFSFHSVPERHIKKGCDNGHCKLNEQCCSTYSEKNFLCYKAQCHETVRLIANKLNLKPAEYSTGFQSRLASRVKDPWLKPYCDTLITDLAKEGKKKLLVFSPAFVADCLETLIEIGVEYNELFQEHGGEKIQLVDSLNDQSLFQE
jgi:ferrochelatase